MIKCYIKLNRLEEIIPIPVDIFGKETSKAKLNKDLYKRHPKILAQWTKGIKRMQSKKIEVISTGDVVTLK